MFPGKGVAVGGVLRALVFTACDSCLCVFVVGLYFCFSKLTDQNIFIILYGITSVYFAVSKLALLC